MHEWHTRTSTDVQSLIDQFIGYEFDTDHSGRQEVTRVSVTNRMFRDSSEAQSYVERASYGGNTAYIAACTTSKLTKAYQTAFDNFTKRYNEYITFERELNIGYGRKSSKVTCPHCESSISLKYGSRFKRCPICGSEKIISDSNWNALKTKKNLAAKASDVLSREASKCGVTFVCGIEWHC